MNFALANPVKEKVAAESRLSILIEGMQFAMSYLLTGLYNANESLNDVQLKRLYVNTAKDMEKRINAYLNESKTHPDKVRELIDETIAHDNSVRRKLGLPEREKGGTTNGRES